eukprot:356817-Alexandrium_andersonii.AAC.1
MTGGEPTAEEVENMRRKPTPWEIEFGKDNVTEEEAWKKYKDWKKTTQPEHFDDDTSDSDDDQMTAAEA